MALLNGISRYASRLLQLRLNRRYFFAGLGATAITTAALASSYPWVLNGGFVLPWLLLHGARLHDLGRSIVWAAVAITAVLAVLVVLAVLEPPPVIYTLVGGAALLALALFTLWAGLRPGDAGPNRFGPAPSGWSVAMPS